MGVYTPVVEAVYLNRPTYSRRKFVSGILLPLLSTPFLAGSECFLPELPCGESVPDWANNLQMAEKGNNNQFDIFVENILKTTDANCTHERRRQIAEGLANPEFLAEMIQNGGLEKVAFSKLDSEEETIILRIVSEQSDISELFNLPDHEWEERDPHISCEVSSATYFIDSSTEPPGIWRGLLSACQLEELGQSVNNNSIRRYKVGSDGLINMLHLTEQWLTSNEILGVVFDEDMRFHIYLRREDLSSVSRLWCK